MTTRVIIDLRSTSEAIGENVREHRTFLGLTQLSLAQGSGVERGAIAHIEAGRRLPSIRSLYRIAKALNVKAAALLPDKWQE